MIYRKLLRLGTSYKEQANTSEVVQVAVDFFLPMRMLGSFFHIAMNGIIKVRRQVARVDGQIVEATDTMGMY